MQGEVESDIEVHQRELHAGTGRGFVPAHSRTGSTFLAATMRLLDTSTLKLHEFQGKDIPVYAILSHRWETEEVSYCALLDGSGKCLRGWSKIERCCAIARSNGLKYVWIDTCCIDKSSSAELSEAINSMFDWYKNSKICYAYLSDVSSKDNDRDAVKRAFAASKWFTRGWTLQELLAPTEVVFFDHEWVRIGTSGNRFKLITMFNDNALFKDSSSYEDSLLKEILAVTGIERLGFLLPMLVSVAKRMSWAARRETTRHEDMAYCLMGLFEVNMPLLYGEGGKAFTRLQLQILQQSDDESIFAWTPKQGLIATGLLASSPAEFADSFDVSIMEYVSRTPYAMTNKGLHISLEFFDVPIPDEWKPFKALVKRCCAAPLNCTRGNERPLSISLIDLYGPVGCRRVGPFMELPVQPSYPHKKDDFYIRQPHLDAYLAALEMLMEYMRWQERGERRGELRNMNIDEAH